MNPREPAITALERDRCECGKLHLGKPTCGRPYPGRTAMTPERLNRLRAFERAASEEAVRVTQQLRDERGAL